MPATMAPRAKALARSVISSPPGEERLERVARLLAQLEEPRALSSPAASTRS